MAVSLPFVRKKEDALAALKQLLAGAGVVVTTSEELVHGVKLYASFRETTFGLVLYFTEKTGRSSKVVLERETEEARRAVVSALEGSLTVTLPSRAASSSAVNPLLDGIRGACRIGIDESGKGDYFGPLVIAGVSMGPDDEPKLIEIGVKDSKLLQDKQITVIADKIRALATPSRYEVIFIKPEKYNELYATMRNLNRLLAWGHARVLENLLERNSCDLAVCDQFGDESYIKRAVMEKGKAIRLIQTPRAEQDIAVAAASILARDTFVRKLAEMSRKYGVDHPKGASPQVEEAARDLVREHGKEELAKVGEAPLQDHAKSPAGGLEIRRHVTTRVAGRRLLHSSFPVNCSHKDLFTSASNCRSSPSGRTAPGRARQGSCRNGGRRSLPCTRRRVPCTT